MIKEYLNKPCKITIALGQYTTAGSAPLKMIGTITNADNEYVEFQFDSNDKNNPMVYKGTSGKMLVKKDYIISVVLL